MSLVCWSDSDSEYVLLLVIQTSHSYELNTMIPRNFAWQDRIVAEVVGMTKRLRTMEGMSVSVAKTESKTDDKVERLDEILFDVVDETLKRVFKEAGAEAIYNYIENKCHLKREEIAEKTEVFSAGLERMLGSGALVIEKLMLKNLYRKLGLKFTEKEGYGFSDYVKELRKSAVVEA